MSYAIEPQLDPRLARPRDCSRGGGRNSDHRMIDIIEHDDFSRRSTVDPDFRVIDSDGFETLARVLNIQYQSARGEFAQLVRRERIAAVPLGDGDYRFRVVR